MKKHVKHSEKSLALPTICKITVRFSDNLLFYKYNLHKFALRELQLLCAIESFFSLQDSSGNIYKYN